MVTSWGVSSFLGMSSFGRLPDLLPASADATSAAATNSNERIDLGSILADTWTQTEGGKGGTRRKVKKKYKPPKIGSSVKDRSVPWEGELRDAGTSKPQEEANGATSGGRRVGCFHLYCTYGEGAMAERQRGARNAGAKRAGATPGTLRKVS